MNNRLSKFILSRPSMDSNTCFKEAKSFVQQRLCAALAKRLAWPGGTFANLM